jgi:hypothetical protein
MQQVQFDSFGEPLPEQASVVDAPARTGSRVALRTGMGLFWSLVVVIVTARAFFFDPDFASQFSRVADLAHTIRSALGV